MKKMKKLSAVLFSLVIVLATCITAFATTPPDYSITVTDAYAGETYRAYKMLDLTVDNPESPTAYTYTVNSNWQEFSDTKEFKAVFSVDSLGYVTSSTASESGWQSSGPVSALAEKAAEYVQTKNLSAENYVTIAEGATSGTINLTGPGYYIVTSTMGSRSMITTTPDLSAVSIIEKNDKNSVLKYVKENDGGDFNENKNTAQIGETIEFRTAMTIVPRSVNIKLHDTMDSGLKFDPSSVEVYTAYSVSDPGKNTLCDPSYYTLKCAGSVNGAPDDGDTFTINFTNAIASTITSPTEITVLYNAHLCNEAIKNDGTNITAHQQRNVAYISYGDKQKSVENETITTTFKAQVFKYYLDKTIDPTQPKEVHLANAVFALHKGATGTHEEITDDTLIKLVKIDDNNYRVADADEIKGECGSHIGKDESLVPVDNGALVKDFKTVADKDIYIWGLDSDTDYSLYEIKAPEGYNKLTGDTQLVFDTSKKLFNEVKILNNTGTELPTTGGIGTTVFYIAGGILVIVAAVFFVVRRKMNKEESA